MVSADTDCAATVLTLRQRAEDLHERSRIGGIFYLFSWLLVAGFGNGWYVYPVLTGLVSAVLLVLMVLRIALRERSRRQPESVEQTMRWQWGVLIFTGAFWGALAGWALLDPVFEPSRVITLISTASLATAFAQVFAISRRMALLGTGLVYLPMLCIVVFVQREPGLSLVLGLNSLYLVAVIFRSHGEYEGKLTLDEELREQRDRFAQQSRTDALTGIANRGHFQQRLEQVVAEARAGGPGVALLIADLDHFKSVNDRFGHAAGDLCLREVAGLLCEGFVGEGVLVARLGGEEFAVLVAGDQLEGVALLAETFRVRLGRRKIEPGGGVRFGITVSLGLARFSPDQHLGGDALYAAADEALYRAKAAGRNRLEAA